MRVIAGSRRSLPLKTVKSDAVRPTTDRIKETLFNMLDPYVRQSRFLDLFAGSGAIGIEALSRGAEHAWFVERDRKAAAVIDENLRFTRIIGKADVLRTDVLTAIRELSFREEKPMDLIFLDPPYAEGLVPDVLRALAGSPLLSRETLVIVEASVKADLSKAEEAGYTVFKDKVYKTNRHVWLKRKEE